MTLRDHAIRASLIYLLCFFCIVITAGVIRFLAGESGRMAREDIARLTSVYDKIQIAEDAVIERQTELDATLLIHMKMLKDFREKSKKMVTHR